MLVLPRPSSCPPTPRPGGGAGLQACGTGAFWQLALAGRCPVRSSADFVFLAGGWLSRGGACGKDGRAASAGRGEGATESGTAAGREAVAQSNELTNNTCADGAASSISHMASAHGLAAIHPCSARGGRR